MFFFYVSFCQTELAADWLIEKGGHYMAAIAMHCSPIIPFRRDHPEAPHPSISLHSFPLPSLSSCSPHPSPLHTRMQRWVNRAPPAPSEQMGAEKTGAMSFSPSLGLSLSLSLRCSCSLILSPSFPSVKPQNCCFVFLSLCHLMLCPWVCHFESILSDSRLSYQRTNG